MMWFKVSEWQKETVESVSDEDAGAGLKAAFKTLMGETNEKLSPGANDVYRAFYPDVMAAVSIQKYKQTRRANERF